MENSTSLIRDADPAKDLACGGDDFSVKVSSNLDKRFWVRIEREPEQGMLVVTDFTAGERSYAELAAALSIGLRAARVARLRGLLFRDIVPGGDQVEGFPVKLLRAADLVKQLGASVAADLATQVASFDLQPRRGKVDAVIAFSSVPAVTLAGGGVR